MAVSKASNAGGYGYQHRRRRAALLPAAIGTPCPGAAGGTYRSPRCDRVMTNPQRMHLDHTVAHVLGGTRGDVICCLPCNTGAGAALGNRLRRPQKRRASRNW